MTAGAGEGFRHVAALFEGLDAMVESVLPFVHDGVVLGEPVLVAIHPRRAAGLREALGDDADAVTFVDLTEAGGNPARLIPRWHELTAGMPGGGPVRGVCEPAWPGRRPAEIEECLLHESLLNLAFADGPSWQLLCPYDVSALPPGVIEDALRAHPEVRGSRHRSTGYGGAEAAASAFAAPLPQPPPGADSVPFGADDLSGLRAVVGRLCQQAGMTPDPAADMTLAAHELAANSLLHGGGRGTLRAWTEPGALVVEVSDSGVITDPLVGRDLVRSLEESGRGVWMANQLCDLVQVRSGADGTVVRLFAWL